MLNKIVLAAIPLLFMGSAALAEDVMYQNDWRAGETHYIHDPRGESYNSSDNYVVYHRDYSEPEYYYEPDYSYSFRNDSGWQDEREHGKVRHYFDDNNYHDRSNNRYDLGGNSGMDYNGLFNRHIR